MSEQPTSPTRRHVLQASTAAGAVLALGGIPIAPARASTPTGHSPTTLEVTDLRVGYLRAPIGIDDPAPTLTWRLSAPHATGVTQTAYQIRVASTQARLNQPDLWDSGRVASSAQWVAYSGRRLRSRDQAYFQIRIWDGAGKASAWSAPVRWEMGLLDPADWSARWITNPDWDRKPTPVTILLQRQSARYVKLDVTRLGLPLKEGGWSYKVSRLQLSEVVVTDSADPTGADLAKGAPVTASESYTVAGAWAPQYLTDGKLTSDTAPYGYTSLQYQDQKLTTPIWVQIDLGQTQTFDQILLYPRTDALTDDGQTPNFPVDFTVQTCSDGVSFTTTATVTGQAPPPPLHAVPAAQPVFSKDFTLTRRIHQARLYITALGVFDATLNGASLDDAVLEPPNTLYTSRTVYSTHDVTALLRPGGNTLRVEIGNGMANVAATPGRYTKLTRSDGPPSLLAQLEIQYLDGSTETIATGPSWKTALGATTYSHWYGGEDYDARRTISAWSDAVAASPPGPSTVLSGRTAPPIRIVETVRPVKITNPGAGTYVFDLGVNIAGWPRLKVSGPAGTRVTMRPGELLLPDGTVSQATTGSPIWDTYTLSGRGAETWHPRFSYHGFRYLQVEGLPGAPTTSTVTGLVLRTANDGAGSFDCSDDLINGIHRIIDRSVQSNMYSVLTDCPHREKLGWLEQDNLAFGALARNYDVAAHLRKIVRDMADAQTPSGLIPDIAPEYTVFSGGFRDDPNWGGTFVLTPWQMYLTYGDVATLRTHYPAMRRYLDYLAGRANGHLLDYGLGDWVEIDSTPVGVAASHGYHQIASAMARIAAVLGQTADAAAYTTLTTQIGEAFNATYLDASGHTYASGSQASDALALDMGIVPEDQRKPVLDHLIGGIRAKGNHLTVGEIGLPAVFSALSAAGRDDVVHDIVTQTNYPSYGYFLKTGSTSLPEYWTGATGDGSQNHFMLGCVDEWFTSRLGGIRQADGSAGYRDLVIAPSVVGALTSVRAEYVSVYGPIRTAWQRRGKALNLSVSVPPNTTATVHVPLAATGATQVTASHGLRQTGVKDGCAIYRTGSGEWSFTTR